MKFIIYICNRLRQGQFPRMSDFPYNEQLGKYIYQGKIMDVHEFNAACETIFDPNYRTSGYNFRPLAIIEANASPNTGEPDAYERKQLGKALAKKTVEKSTSEDSEPTSEEIKSTSEDSNLVTKDFNYGFFQDGDDIYHEGRIVGRLFEGKLKMVKGEGELREKALAFIASAGESPAAEPLV